MKIYVSKRNEEVTSKIVKENEKFKTVELELLTGEKAGSIISITSSTLKRWWKAIESDNVTEVIEQEKELEIEVPVINSEVAEHKLVPMPGIEKLAELKAEYSNDSESELTDEEYVKTKFETADQAKDKERKHRACKKVEFVGDKPTDDSIIDKLSNANINYKKYDNKSDFSILDEAGKAKARVFIQNKKMRIQTKSLNDFASKLSDVVTGYKHTLSNVIFVEYNDTCLDTMLKVIE